VSIEYVDLVDYVAIAAEVTDLDVDTIIRLPNLALAESALHAPAAGFGEQEFYPDFVGKAAVLITRLARNHPLPDGNKRTAWVALRLFIDINDWSWDPMPSVDEAEHAVLAITAGEWNEQQTADWLRAHLAPRPHS
jgi:death-on-curing protein